MILLKQLARTYREVFPTIFFNLARIFPPPRYACSSNAETLAKYYLQRGGLNNLRGHNNFYSKFEYLQSKLGNDGAFRPLQAARQATVTDGCVSLILLLQLQTRRQLTLATQRQIWHGWRNPQPTEKCLAYWLIDHSAYII